MPTRASAPSVHPRIVRNPKIMGGEPVVEGTRVPVSVIVMTHRLEPGIAALTEAYPTIDAAGIQAALAYYDSHREEIDRYIAEYEAEDDVDGSH